MRRISLALLLLATACAGNRNLRPDARAELDALAARGALQPGQPIAAAALEPLNARFAEARIIGLGRPLAGGHEFVVLARDLFLALVRDHGVTGLALDVSIKAGFALDAWATAAGAPDLDALDAILLDLDEPALRTAELRDFIAAVRAHNAAGPKGMLHVHGTDPGELDSVARGYLGYLELVDPDHAARATAILRGGDGPGLAALLKRFDAQRPAYVERSSASAYARARMQAEASVQLLDQAESWAFDAPEFHRARNLDLALQLGGPGYKLFFWGENRRAAADVPGGAPSVGEYLRQWHGRAYVAIGGLFVRGRAVLERSDGRLCPLELPPARAGSFDAVFAGLAGPALLAVPTLLRGSSLQRSLGGKPAIRAIEGAYDPVDASRYNDPYKSLATAFDALLVVPTVTAAGLAPGLGRPGPDGCVELL
ncbi:erythromycin esterase family protein [Nannocystis bainbridge]|uniref:Erythromycin esterase family protein n=1 Tax=Nannocystis bainbridge TaxID=2995303 RepID=A0ABT5DYV4_9BACT|nr:erythromycin esterase family protein [Nannocystis bainbridge]MDC0718759.1 erythromycin esterase family protein [Nannocystis bainbridge]